MTTESKTPVSQQSPMSNTPKPSDGGTRCPPVIRLREILVPTDFSDNSTAALKYALSLAEQFQARITLVYAIEPIPYAEGVSLPLPTAADLTAIGDRVIADASRVVGKPEAEQSKLLRNPIVEQGIAWEVIVHTAASQKSNLIVLATHGRTGLAHVFLGSTAEKVIRHAPCPVLVIRPQFHKTNASAS